MKQAVRARELPFWVTFSLSAGWHLLCFSAITIVSFPAKVQLPHFSEISFFGSLLDEPSFEVHVIQRQIFPSQTVLLRENLNRSTLETFPERPADSLGVAFPYANKSWGLSEESLGLQKKNPLLIPKEETFLQREKLLIKGPASVRTLYYHPSFPGLPKWLNPKEVLSRLELRFWVSPEGKVIAIEKLTSSGDPTLDLIGIRHLRRWQFNPKKTEMAEWGTATLHFTSSSDPSEGMDE